MVKLGVFDGNWSLLSWQDPAAIVPVSASCQVRCDFSSYVDGGSW